MASYSVMIIYDFVEGFPSYIQNVVPSIVKPACDFVVVQLSVLC